MNPFDRPPKNKVNLSQRPHIPGPPIPNFRRRNVAVGTLTASGNLFVPHCACTVMWILAQFNGATTVQLLINGDAVGAPLPATSGCVIRFAGTYLMNNETLSLSLSPGVTVQFEVAWIKDICPDLIVRETDVFFPGSSSGASTVTANQGTANAGSKWSVQIDGPNPLPTSAADGQLVTVGAVADAAVTGDVNGTLSAKLRGLSKILANVWDSVNSRLNVAIQNTPTVTISANPLPTSAADGQLVTVGAVADAAVTGDTSGSLSAKLRGLSKMFNDVWDSVNHRLNFAIKAPVDSALSVLVSTEGQKKTYRVSGSGAASLAGVVNVLIVGSATKIVKILRICVSVTIPTAAANAVVLHSWSALPTGGTATHPALLPSDQSDGAATASINIYTVAPTGGTNQGPIGSWRFISGAPTGAGVSVTREWNFGGEGAKPLTLRTAAQAVSILLSIAGHNYDYDIELTEE